MQKDFSIEAVLLAILGVALLVFFAPLFGILFGSFTGWVVGMFYPHTLDMVISFLHLPQGTPYWQLGAILGFLSGFIKSSTTTSKSKSE